MRTTLWCCKTAASWPRAPRNNCWQTARSTATCGRHTLVPRRGRSRPQGRRNKPCSKLSNASSTGAANLRAGSTRALWCPFSPTCSRRCPSCWRPTPSACCCKVPWTARPLIPDGCGKALYYCWCWCSCAFCLITCAPAFRKPSAMSWWPGTALPWATPSSGCRWVTSSR